MRYNVNMRSFAHSYLIVDEVIVEFDRAAHHIMQQSAAAFGNTQTQGVGLLLRELLIDLLFGQAKAKSIIVRTGT